MNSDPAPPPAGPPPQVRAAGVLVGLEALLGLGFAVALVVRSLSSEFGAGAVLGEAALFALMALALLAVAAGLLTGRRGARTPAIVTQLLLLPVVYSLIGPSRQLVLGLVSGAVVITAFMLLISEPSRYWSMGVDRPGSPRT
ncbi:MAG TPA: hypothetical protein VD813_14980 [Pseudonocardia sp.]|nr:hypothetical protein [Pseudonocardia sp.]